MIHYYYPKDNEGYLINDTAIDKISSCYQPLIEKIKEILLSELASSLHSIYLTGSMPRGLSKKNTSDLDIFAILMPFCSNDKLPTIQQKCHDLLYHFPVVSKIDIELWSFEEVFPKAKGLHAITVKKTLSCYDIILKIASLCIYGNDLTQYIPRIKPSIALANDELSVIHEDIREAKEALSHANNKKVVPYWCKRVMKNIVRAGFCLCMPKINEYTRDIVLCAKIFNHYYPNLVDFMNQALNWAQAPSDEAVDVYNFLNTKTLPFLNEVEKWMIIHNSKHKRELSRDL